jgi:NAD(P)-dependent dehydrogenase (short-subunit alcohol dehydrogenase family)
MDTNAADSDRVPGLPFIGLNLRCNPFGEVDRCDRVALAVTDAGDLAQRLARPGVAVQFVDEPGRGKTTHLLSLAANFSDAPFVRVDEGATPEIPEAHPLFIDEAQRLPWRVRHRVFGRGDSVAIATSRDLGRELARHGLEVLTIAPGTTLTVRRVTEILNRRIHWARRGPGSIPQVGAEQAAGLLAHFGSDLRAIEEHLYEQFQAMAGGASAHV